MSQSEIVVEGRNLTIGYQVGKKRTEVHSRLNFQLFRWRTDMSARSERSR